MSEEKRYVICPACGHRTSGNFCSNCGAALPVEDEDYLFEESLSDRLKRDVEKELEERNKRTMHSPKPKKKPWMAVLAVIVVLAAGVVLLPRLLSGFGNVDLAKNIVDEEDFVCLAKNKEHVKTFDGQNDSRQELHDMQYAVPFGWHKEEDETDYAIYKCNSSKREAELFVKAEESKAASQENAKDMLRENMVQFAKDSCDKALTKMHCHSFETDDNTSLFACYTGKQEKKKVDIYLVLILDLNDSKMYSFRLMEPVDNTQTNYDDFITMIKNTRIGSSSFVQGDNIWDIFDDWDPFSDWDDIINGLDDWDIHIDWNIDEDPDTWSAEFDARMLLLDDLSKKRIIEEMEKKGYSQEIAEKAVENLGDVDWGLHAMSYARKWLRRNPCSAVSLEKQLLSEEFTEEEVEYAIKYCGVDWNSQAWKYANKIKGSVDTREELLAKLKEEGFTDEQAEYGVDKAW